MKKYLVSGLIGFGISVGCLLPPILHLVTGPLGPAIGGFVGGMRAKAKFDGALIIGLVMGSCLGLLVAIAGLVLLKYQFSLPGMMNKMIDTGSMTYGSVFKIALIPFGVAAILGTIGAVIGGRVIGKETDQPAQS